MLDCWRSLLLIVMLCPIGFESRNAQGFQMTQDEGRLADETARFHRIVTEGNLADLRSALEKGANVNAPDKNGMTALMLAVESKDLEKTKLLIQHGADPELTDDFNSTALRRAVSADFVEGVRFLLSLGVDRGYHPRYPLKKIDYDFPLPDAEMPAELKGVISEAEWRESLEETRRVMRELGQNPTVQPMISEVESVEVLRLFLEAGDDLSLAPTEIKRVLVGLPTEGELKVTEGDYRKHKSPQFGKRNPESMNFPFWKDMIRTGGNAYTARLKFDDDEPFTKAGVVWCYDRFGSTLTELGDGRFVQIGGEHEDFYDPDFYIYNDVVIHDGRGEFQVYGYAKDVFPPTDFHTSTLCPDGIYIIGCLGYVEERVQGFTPVYRLKLDTWKIESVKTAGEMPGWLHRHSARYEPGRNTIHVEGGEIHVVTEDEEAELIPNEQEFELDLRDLRWRKLK